MNRSKLSLRRSFAVLGAAFVGLAASVALASPASAHDSVVVGEALCDTRTGEYAVKWTISVDHTPPEATHYRFTEVLARQWVGETVTELSVPNIAVTGEDVFPHPSDGQVVGEHRIPGNSTNVALHVKVAWNNGFHQEGWSYDTVHIDGTCKKVATTKPDAEAQSDCENLVVKLINGADANTPARFTVTGTGGFVKTVVVEPGPEPGEVSVPRDKADSVVVTEEGSADYKETFAYKDPGNCGEPDLLYKATCEGLAFQVVNPEDGQDIEVTFTPNKGDAVTIKLKADESSEPVVFPAAEGLTVKVELKGADEQLPPFVYEDLLEEDCDGEGGGGPLPVTGPQTGALAGGAGLLLAVGVGLFVVTRRRRMRFTA